jgi:3'(2'), 5'-bisphosphate nucleotidase
MFYNTLLFTAIDTALLAGKAILDVYGRKDVGIETKTDNSPITLADKAAHHIINEKLEATKLPVLSEEGEETSYEVRKKWKRFWLVDPLDGTKEFIKKSGEFTVNIALIEDAMPILGVVYIPVEGVIYYTDNEGAYRSEDFRSMGELLENARKLPFDIHHDEFVVAASVSHLNTETDAFIKWLDTKSRTLKVINKGSSIKLCMVAEGSVDCYPRLGKTMEWDTAAGHAILLKSGKNILQLPTNKEFVYNKPDLSNPWFIAL